ncbi:MAG: O-methyltransferase [Phycisphaerae bacterium]
MQYNQVVKPGIEQGLLPALSPDTLASLHFGEGCLIEEYLFLRSLAILLRPARILELGTSCGVGGLMLLDGATAFGRTAHLTTIDVSAKREFEANSLLFPHLRRHVERIIAPSDEALPALARQQRKFDLAFLDGDHSAEQVARDWNQLQRLCHLHIVHDTDQMPGCRQLVARIRDGGGFDVMSFSYPLGHQVFHALQAEGNIYDGIYHQSQLVWTTATHGPGLTLIRRREAVSALSE